MLLPPTRVIPPEVMLVVAPAVLPLEICRELKPTGGDEIVTLLLLIPTEAAPAPEIFKSPENVPAELRVVFPRAVKDWVIV